MHRRRRGPRGFPVNASSVPCPTDGLDALATSARASRIAASALRWLAACALACAALLAVAVALVEVDRTRGPDPALPSASAYLDFDLGVLRAIAQRSFDASVPDARLRALWDRRPPWRLPAVATEEAHAVSLHDAWAASVAEKSRFRGAARGAYDALGLLLGGLCLALAAAALGGALAERIRAAAPATPAAARRTALAAAAAVLVLLPLSGMLDPALFYDRTRSAGTGAAALIFVAGFAGAMSGAGVRSLFAPPSQAEFLTALSGRPALLSAARLSALEATRWLVPLVPALAAAAVVACAKAYQDPSLHGESSGLGALIRAAMGEVSAADRLSSAALAGGALVVLWYLGHRFVLEVRASLGTRGTAG
jgi:hypothetical protein